VARARPTEDSEALPEADRLEGFPHPRETRALYGQDACERVLAKAFAGGRMHHAWMFTGREGVGKATLGYRLAKHALARPEERDASGLSLAIAPQTAAHRQVVALSHPGLLLLRRPCDPRSKRIATSIPVDEVRRLKSFLGLTGGQDSWRVVIVDSADELNGNAANALLKSLEEPPQRALFVLISAAPNGILPTIRSRCRRLELAPLGENDLQRAVLAALAAVGAQAPAAEAFSQLERLAKGSVRAALQLAGSGGLELYRQIEALFGALPNLDWSAAHGLSDQLVLAGHEQRFEAFFDLFLDHLSRLVRAAATGDAEAHMRQLAERLIGAGRLPMWAGLWQTVLSDRNEAARLNLDRKALLLAALARLEGLARG
jgi:DNA polymerase-3 subunit delta'